MEFNWESTPKFCISLLRSQDRRATVSAELKKANIDFTFFDAVDKNNIIVPELSIKKPFTEAPGVLACALSHVALIRHARDNNIPAICIFEDDVILCDDFHDRIKYIQNLKNFRFDFFSLGGHFRKEFNDEDASKTEWNHIYRTKNMGGTYAYIITERVYNFIIRNYNYNFGADEFYGNFVYRRFNSYAFVPFLVGCKPCKSEITDVYWKYENIDWHYRQNPVPGLV